MTETEEITTKNLEIVKKFIEPIKHFTQGMLLTGSNAWGAFYAVTPTSDIDLFIIPSGIDELEKIIESYITFNLINLKERERFEIFRKLHNENKTNHFSMIAHCENTPVSIDFIFPNTIKDITSFAQMKKIDCEGVAIRVVNEFRVNVPRSTGYALDDLKNQRKIIYHPKFEEIKNDEGEIIGYLSETLVDGQTEDKTTYFLGVISFFLGVNPVVLFDKDGWLKDEIKLLQSNIAWVLKGELPSYITRQERMSKEVLDRIRKSLVGQNL